MTPRDDVTGAAQADSKPSRSWFRQHWFSLALSVLVLATVLFLVDLKTAAMPGPLLVSAVWGAAYLNATLHALLLLGSFWPGGDRGQRAARGLGLLLGLAPVGAWSLGTQLRLYDVSFLLRKESDLNAGVRRGRGLYDGLEVADSIAGLTLVRVGSWTMSSSYWLIQSPSGPPTLPQFCTAYRVGDEYGPRVFKRLRPLWGSWYRLID